MNKNTCLAAASYVALAAVLATFGLVKLLSTHRGEYALFPLLYYGIAVIEVGLALAILLPATRRSAAIAVAALALGSLGMTIFLPDVNCGCGGAYLPLSARAKAILAFFMWMLAIASLRTAPKHEGTKSHSRSQDQKGATLDAQ